MSFKRNLKYFFRSGSLQFSRDLVSGIYEKGKISIYNWKGIEISYRPGTSDPYIIYEVLLKKGRKGEYFFPVALQPKVIFDIGANIGVTSILLAKLFPEAKIFSIEPVKENFDLLSKNICSFSNIVPVNIAFDSECGERELIFSPNPHNFGGFSFFQRCADGKGERVVVKTMTPAQVMRENGIDKIDLIKIDTEGAESPILRSFDARVLSNVTWIVGELHGEQDDFDLLSYLSQWFDIEMKRSFKKSLFIFNACNKKQLNIL